MPLVHELYRVAWTDSNQVEQEDFVFCITKSGIRDYVSLEKHGFVTGIWKATRDEALLELSRRITDLKDIVREKDEALLTAREAVEEVMERHDCNYKGVIRGIDTARELQPTNFVSQ